ncbi:GNAT family N-acetyltransferase [Nocardioides pocheonensis]|uniref:GNAT family N-acetyltransferase n=1 Tax=Nocardioides pocheonensis TaxID=661485 RepID=A0A3N0GPD5_9ACTN|nr:GNAT family N-acetyltransferase [Nocardioides pocheonensis]RNM14334.1 GNAT family N-acetyltransferase [Nocardioides pocheonensis]
MDVRLAGRQDVEDLAHLLWLHAAPEERARQTVAAFAVDLAAWWSEHGDSHHAFVAVDGGSEVVGMAWLALLPRVPRPGAPDRRFGDVQSVFVVPEHRGRGLGSTLVETAAEHAVRLGAARVTVHSSRQAVPLYERLGFASSQRLLQRPAE